MADWAEQIWRDQTRYMGVGAMLVGGLWTVFRMRKTLLQGVASGLRAYRSVDGTGQAVVEVPRTERDMPMKWILILMVLSVIPLFFVYHAFVQRIEVSITMAVLMLIAGFAFSAVAAYMAGLVGSSNNPISGVTITTIVFSAFFLMLLIGKGAPIGPAAAIIIGAVVCCAASIAGDNLQDLKTGYIVGATPWKQQVMLAIGTLTGAAVIAPVLTLLQQAYGFAGQPVPGSPAAAGAPGQRHGRRGQGHLRRRAGLDLHHHRHDRRRRPDRPRHDPRKEEESLPHAGPGGGDRHLSAVLAVRGDLPRRRGRILGQACPRQTAGDARKCRRPRSKRASCSPPA